MDAQDMTAAEITSAIGAEAGNTPPPPPPAPSAFTEAFGEYLQATQSRDAVQVRAALEKALVEFARENQLRAKIGKDVSIELITRDGAAVGVNLNDHDTKRGRDLVAAWSKLMDRVELDGRFGQLWDAFTQMARNCAELAGKVEASKNI
jgi:hypothetical protein